MGVLHLETAFRPESEAGAETPVCARCGAPAVTSKTVSMAFWRGTGLYVIRDIPILCCGACQDQHLDEGTVLALDRMRGGGLTTDTMDEAMIVPVYRFTPADRR